MLSIKLIVGLGNPGRCYKFTRHNIGAAVVEKIAEENKVLLNKEKFDAKFARGSLWGDDILLALPQTYMNRSGLAVCAFLAWKRVDLADALVICDDVNLPLGEVRIRRSGSSGGHNGLSSIIDTLGDEGFPRLRVGIGCGGPGEKGGLADYVLAKFKKAESDLVEISIKKAVSCCEAWAVSGIAVAMNKFNKQRGR